MCYYESMLKRLGLLALAVMLLTTACQKTRPDTPSLTSPVAPYVRVHFVDVGQGDAIWVETWEGKNLVIDGGSRHSNLTPYLNQHKVKEIEALTGTNPDADHIGGLIDVLDSIPVKNVWISGQENTTITFEDFLKAIGKSGATIHRARRGDKFDLGSITVDVLHPTEPFLQSRNNNSVVLRLKFGSVSFLFTGDAEKEAEASMIAANLPLESTILKLGHHGSRTSTSPNFLAVVKPQLAVYQAGAGNSYGHPHRETIQALRSANARILGTDVNGTIIATTDGKSYTVQTER